MNRREFNKAAVAAAALPLTSVRSASAAPALPAGFELRRAADRGVAELGWLSSRHSFSFGRYFDPAQMGFSDLMVINEDRVTPGQGFGTHPHRGVEIFTYVLEGELEHKDSMGNGEVIRPGDVQFMSAGRGVTHSEFNPSKTEGVHFLQIWLAPNEVGTEPGYQQQHFSVSDKDGKLALVIAPAGHEGALSIRQSAKVYAGTLTGDQAIDYSVPEGRNTYVHIVRGSLTLNGVALSAGDGVKVREGQSVLQLANGTDAEVLVFDLNRVGLAESRG